MAETRPPADRSQHFPVRHLITAVALTAVTTTAVVGDIILTDLAIPAPLIDAGRTGCVLAWLLWYAARRFNQIDRQLGERLDAATFAEGYVQGVARRAPSGGRVPYLDD